MHQRCEANQSRVGCILVHATREAPTAALMLHMSTTIVFLNVPWGERRGGRASPGVLIPIPKTAARYTEKSAQTQPWSEAELSSVVTVEYEVSPEVVYFLTS